MSDTIEVKPRTQLGSRHSQKLRAEGYLPAVLYGRGEEPVSLSVSIEQMRDVVRHGSKVLELEGAATGQALLQEIQWNTFGNRPLHIDLMRVKAGEVVHLEVTVELKGECAGEREGGMVDHAVHTVEIEAPPASIPEKLHLDVTEMQLGGSLSAGDIIDLPEGAKLITPADTMLVHCVQPKAESEEQTVAGAAEPEVIGAKDKEESEG